MSTLLPRKKPCFAPLLSRGVGTESPPSSAAAALDPPETSSQPRTNIDQNGPGGGNVQGGEADFDDPMHYVNPDFLPFEHRGWQPIRKKIYSSMIRTEVSAARRHRFWTCCERVHVFENPLTSEVDYRLERCHDRFCMPCGQLRSWRIARSIDKMMAKEKCWFITLTLRGRPGDSLKSMIEALSVGWKEIRRLPGWKKNVTGGACMLEVKWSSTSGGHWHPHYHIIAHGPGVDEGWLSRAWSVVTRGSDQVKVLPVADKGAAIGYVAKYASKPLDPSFTSRQDLLDEAMVALRGKRLCSCFGTWHGVPLHEEEQEYDPTEIFTTWSYCGTTSDLEARAAKGDRHASDLLERVRMARELRSVFAERSRGHGPAHPATGPPAGAVPNLGGVGCLNGA